MKLRLARRLRAIANRLDPPPPLPKFPTAPPGADWNTVLGYERAAYVSQLATVIALHLPPSSIELTVRYDDGSQVLVELKR